MIGFGSAGAIFVIGFSQAGVVFVRVWWVDVLQSLVGARPAGDEYWIFVFDFCLAGAIFCARVVG